MVKKSLYQTVNELIIPYSIGVREFGNVISIKKNNYWGSDMGGGDLLFSNLSQLKYEINGNTYFMRNLTVEDKRFIESQGEDILIMVNPYNPKYNTPFLPKYLIYNIKCS